MSRVDTAWLRMDSPENLMMIVGVWLLEPRVSIDAVRQRVEERLLKYRRFRQRVVEDAMGASWVDHTAFDITQHVVEERLKADTKAALQARVGQLAAQPLPASRPLWQMHVIEDYRGRTALIARIHHCIADGIALIGVMLSITDGGKAPPARQHAESEDDWIKATLIEPFTQTTIKALGLTGNVTARGFQLLGAAIENPLKSLEPLRLAGQMLQDAVALGAMPDDSPTRLKGKPSGKKIVAWSEPMALDEVKAVGKALGCSVNDVLLGCVSGAIGAYLRDKGDDPDGQEIRAMVPVNLRPMEQAWKLGNRFGLVPLVLPIGVANPVQRVFTVHKRMGELKGSYQPILAFSVLAVAGLLVKPAQHALLGSFSKKATAVMTNVPGPAGKLRFCGSTLEQTMFWVPQSGDIGMGVSILSYGGGVQFGLITDRGLCPDPQKIIDRFKPEFDKLLDVVMLMPWA
ncbi:MAG: wax ester/triacylglycerol synthase family O-acyltransferase [Betaproteobacteria bacterium]|nr:wax ester/triacylglycerol synthase family O-acyltransferase [Betaproteobacteria bacterium]